MHRSDIKKRCSLVKIWRGLIQRWVWCWQQIRPQWGLGPFVLSVGRSLRVFWVPLITLSIVSTSTYRRYAGPLFSGHLLHFVFNRHYLRAGLSVRQRARLALEHVRFEERFFNSEYFRMIYEGDGLILWQRSFDPHHFHISMKLGDRSIGEGDIEVCLKVNGQSLHKINFSWIRAGRKKDAFVPFVTRTQARWRKDRHVLDIFEQCYPNNSAAYFAIHALQGIARATQSEYMVAVRSDEQVVYEPGEKHFKAAYDDFWWKLGGKDEGGIGVKIAVPFQMKALEDVPSKHRKRSAERRRNWAQINASAYEALSAYLLQPAHSSARGYLGSEMPNTLEA